MEIYSKIIILSMSPKYVENTCVCKYLAKSFGLLPTFDIANICQANIWQLFVRLATRIGKQPMSSPFFFV